MIVEVGGPETDAEGTYRLLVNTIEALKQVPNGMGKGIFYWEGNILILRIRKVVAVVEVNHQPHACLFYSP